MTGNLLNDDTTLSSLGITVEQLAHVEVQSVDPINSPLKLTWSNTTSKPITSYRIPNVITVEVPTGNLYCGVVSTIDVVVTY